MRPRTEAVIGLVALVAAVALAAGLGRRGNRDRELDRRASSFLSGPFGVRGLADGLTRLGVDVRHFRRRTRLLLASYDSGQRTLLALVDPPIGLTGIEVQELLAWHAAAGGGDLLLAGPRTEDVMRCFGYAVDWRGLDSAAIRPAIPVVPDSRPWPSVAGYLAGTTDTVVVDSSRISDVTQLSCAVPAPARVDTLLVGVTGRVVAVRLVEPGGRRQVLLFADAQLLRNRTIRSTPAGPFMLALLRGYHTVIFEEAHQGFGEGGSLLDETLAWSFRSPWGWAVWQVVGVGLLALFAGAVRFGPVRRVVERRRRSPLEHVRALATALAAARGHDVAIGAIVRGLRRRLQPAGRNPPGDWRPWVERLERQVRSDRARQAVTDLKRLTRPGQTPDGVLRAANDVEDVWEDLRP